MAAKKAKRDASSVLFDLKKTASKKPSSSKTDDRPVIYIDKDVEPDFLELVKLSTLVGQLSITLEQQKNEAKSKLFARFMEMWFNAKTPPKNPRIIILKKDDNGADTTIVDASFLFMVKEYEKGINKILPNKEDLPEDQTPETVLKDMLTSKVVGLTSKNADQLIKNEVTVLQQLNFVNSIDEMLNSSDDVIAKAATKLVNFLGGGEVKNLTNAERAAILVTNQLVLLKKGFFERACTYVTSAEQLGKLITFVKAIPQLSHYQFAPGDSPAERATRLSQTAIQYVAVE